MTANRDIACSKWLVYFDMSAQIIASSPKQSAIGCRPLVLPSDMGDCCCRPFLFRVVRMKRVETHFWSSFINCWFKNLQCHCFDAKMELSSARA